MTSTLTTIDLHAGVDGKEIVKGVGLTIDQGEVHALMGPNGSGKSTLAYTIMGHPRYIVTGGHIRLDGEDLNELRADERARRGLFLAFQYPYEIPGVALANFLRTAYNAGRKFAGLRAITPMEFQNTVSQQLTQLQMDPSLATRGLNEGFSGGEKKKGEILQLAILNPKIAILDEPDSGLDIDGLKAVSNAINQVAGPDLGILLVTHYQRILRYVQPDFVHVMLDGRIVKSGGMELAELLEEKGYEWVKEEFKA